MMDVDPPSNEQLKARAIDNWRRLTFHATVPDAVGLLDLVNNTKPR